MILNQTKSAFMKYELELIFNTVKNYLTNIRVASDGWQVQLSWLDTPTACRSLLEQLYLDIIVVKAESFTDLLK